MWNGYVGKQKADETLSDGPSWEEERLARGEPSIPSSVCTSYKVDWSNSACLFFLLHLSLRGRPGSATLLVSRWNRNYPFPASICPPSLWRTGRKWKCFLYFPCIFHLLLCLSLSLCITEKGLNNSVCAILFFFSFGKVKENSFPIFPQEPWKIQ